MSETFLSIRFNGRVLPLEVRELTALLERQGYALDRPGIAVAVNGAVVPRRAWAGRPIEAGDVIDVVGATQGG